MERKFTKKRGSTDKKPFKKDGVFFICRNSVGGHVWIKSTEFVSEAVL